jgi:hypothetical protein
MAKDEIPYHIQTWQEESWTAHGGSYNEDAFPIYVDWCVFKDGVHYPGIDCPHGQQIDELGYIHEPGWTVLDNRTKD